jgi:hypothetical protein
MTGLAVVATILTMGLIPLYATMIATRFLIYLLSYFDFVF